MFKTNISFYERKKEVTTKQQTLHKRNGHIKKKGKVHVVNFSGKVKINIMYFWEKK